MLCDYNSFQREMKPNSIKIIDQGNKGLLLIWKGKQHFFHIINHYYEFQRNSSRCHLWKFNEKHRVAFCFVLWCFCIVFWSLNRDIFVLVIPTLRIDVWINKEHVVDFSEMFSTELAGGLKIRDDNKSIIRVTLLSKIPFILSSLNGKFKLNNTQLCCL